MRFLLDNGFYLTDRKNNYSTVTNDEGKGFVVSCDSRMTEEEIVKTMAEIIPFITPRIA